MSECNERRYRRLKQCLSRLAVGRSWRYGFCVSLLPELAWSDDQNPGIVPAIQEIFIDGDENVGASCYSRAE